MGAYMKLYDKNSWLYKESQEKEWPYNFDSQSSWRTIFIVTFSGAPENVTINIVLHEL